MSEFIMKPKVDFAFKEMMTDEKARIGFLSAILGIRPEEIRETRILNPFLSKVHAEDKQKRLEYEAREKAIRDHNQFILEAEQRGVRRGEQNKTICIAKKLKSLGTPVDIIMKSTGLSGEEIEALL